MIKRSGAYGWTVELGGQIFVDLSIPNLSKLPSGEVAPLQTDINEETYEFQSDNDDEEVEPLSAPGADCGLG